MTDSIKVVDLPDEALSVIIATPHALDDEVLTAVGNELERRAAEKRARAIYIRKYISARQHDNVFSLVPGQR